jgi:hypothetical protein
MPQPTYTALATVTLGASASSVTFSSIPATYRDLIVVCNWQHLLNNSLLALRLNGDTGNNYNGVWMGGTGSLAQSSSESNQNRARVAGFNQGPANTFSNLLSIQIMDYSATDKQKTVLSRFGAATLEVQATASRWANTAAVTSVTVVDTFSTGVAAGSRFDLYGVIA